MVRFLQPNCSVPGYPKNNKDTVGNEHLWNKRVPIIGLSCSCTVQTKAMKATKVTMQFVLVTLLYFLAFAQVWNYLWVIMMLKSPPSRANSNSYPPLWCKRYFIRLLRRMRRSNRVSVVFVWLCLFWTTFEQLQLEMSFSGPRCTLQYLGQVRVPWSLDHS